ncbi:unnamed protein product, partial [Vitis vinifera]
MRSPSYKPLQLRLYFRQFFDGPKNFLFCIDFYRELLETTAASKRLYCQSNFPKSTQRK